MKPENKLKIVLQFEQNISVSNPSVRLQDVSKVYCSDKKYLNRIQNIQITRISQGEKKQVMSAIDVIQIIGSHFPDADIEILGENSFIITLASKKNYPVYLEYIKTCFVCLIMFFGAAFSVATFNNDVDVNLLFNQLLGSMKENGRILSILQISYSAGIPLGMLVFYNHLSKKNMYNDPTPLEVEMRLYEQEADTAAILNESRKKENNDN